jgi:uncharacterized protein Yka (UPF0111/DUF47 family)
VRDPYHIKDEVKIEVNKTAAILLDRTDSILDIASDLNKNLDGLPDRCHTPASSPKKPADM